MEMDRRVREVVLPNIPQSGGISKNPELVPEEEGVYSPHQTPQPFGPVPKRLSPKYLSLKINRAHFQETQRAEGN